MSDMDKRLVPPKSALGKNFRPGIAADRFTPVSSLKNHVPPTTMIVDAHGGHNVIADLQDKGNGLEVVKSYVTPGLDANVSMTDHDATATYYYNQDERQNVRNLTDSSAAVVQSYDYTAYGDRIDSLSSGDIEQRYAFTGRELNETSGDYYFRYRMYGAGIGGFLSRDPLGYVDGPGLYNGYFAMRMAMDPDGLITTEPPVIPENYDLPEDMLQKDKEGQVCCKPSAVVKELRIVNFVGTKNTVSASRRVKIDNAIEITWRWQTCMRGVTEDGKEIGGWFRGDRYNPAQPVNVVRTSFRLDHGTHDRVTFQIVVTYLSCEQSYFQNELEDGTRRWVLKEDASPADMMEWDGDKWTFGSPPSATPPTIIPIWPGIIIEPDDPITI